MTLHGYVCQMRLAEARRLLRMTDRPIPDIAAAVGFDGLSGFYRLFTRKTGRPPAVYRREHHQ
ncbi:MAG: helix-turn-helix domain-containing protein [Sporolactobacillus sp.]